MAKRTKQAATKQPPEQKTSELKPLDEKIFKHAESIPWEQLGVYPHDLIGWTFSTLAVPGEEQGAEESTGIIVHAPVTVHIKNGALTWEAPEPESSGFHVKRDWGRMIAIHEGRLVFHLPLLTFQNRSILTIAPPEGTLPDIDKKFRVTTTCTFTQNPDVVVVYELLSDDITIPAGTPLGHLIPIAAYSQGHPQQPQQQQPQPLSHQGHPQQLPQQPIATNKPGETPAPAGPMPENLNCPPELAPKPFTLQVWRIHPEGIRLEPSEKTLRGDAPHGATLWCGPFTHANQYGFWVYPPMDVDIIWYGGRSFDYKIVEEYADTDLQVVQQLQSPTDPFKYSPRNKIDFGAVHDGVVSIWTGCIFQTPPGWSLMIRNPINVTSTSTYRVQDAILETDWMPYDIWLNIQFLVQNQWVRIRKKPTWPPIAQLIPVPREAYENKWNLVQRPMERNSAEGQNMYDRWMQYNYKKWVEKAGKESSTYLRERAKVLKQRPELPESY